RRRDRDDDLRLRHRLLQAVGRCEPRVQGDARQIARVLARRGDRPGHIFLVGPEANAVPLLREQVGEGGPPAPCSDDRDPATHRPPPAGHSSRRSSPRNRRRTLARCAYTMKTASATADQSTGPLPCVTNTATGTTSAAAMDATDTMRVASTSR